MHLFLFMYLFIFDFEAGQMRMIKWLDLINANVRLVHNIERKVTRT